jgi:hypothetical protein
MDVSSYYSLASQESDMLLSWVCIYGLESFMIHASF